MGAASKKPRKFPTEGAIPVCTAHTLIPYLELLIEAGAPVDRFLEK